MCPASKYKYSNTQIQARADRGGFVSSRQQEQQDPGLEQVYLIWYSPLIPFLWNHTIILWPGQNINCLSSAFTIERTDAFIVQPKSARYTNYGSRQYQLVKAMSTVLMKMLQEGGILADSATLVCRLTFCRLVDFDKWIWTWWWDEQAEIFIVIEILLVWLPEIDCCER